MRYFYHQHAWVRMRTRMASVGVNDADVLAVLRNPSKAAAGESGCVNVWGIAKNGVRIRVTYFPLDGEIRTVAIADGRFQ
jgi:hypothetical protein